MGQKSECFALCLIIGVLLSVSAVAETPAAQASSKAIVIHAGTLLLEPPHAPLQRQTVLVVDDQPPFRAVAQTVVAVSHGFEVIGEAESGEAAVGAVAEMHPSVVLMDINLPGMSEIEATALLKRFLPEIQVIIVTVHREHQKMDVDLAFFEILPRVDGRIPTAGEDG